MAVQDPEGILPAPVPHHITRRSYAKKVAEDAEYKEKIERQLQEEKEARRLAREVQTHKLAWIFNWSICRHLNSGI